MTDFPCCDPVPVSDVPTPDSRSALLQEIADHVVEWARDGKFVPYGDEEGEALGLAKEIKDWPLRAPMGGVPVSTCRACDGSGYASTLDGVCLGACSSCGGDGSAPDQQPQPQAPPPGVDKPCIPDVLGGVLPSNPASVVTEWGYRFDGFEDVFPAAEKHVGYITARRSDVTAFKRTVTYSEWQATE